MIHKALSIRQPWAYLIVSGLKDVENRSWNTKFRGRVYVHAGKTFDERGYDHLLGETWGFDLPLKVDYRLGYIIGEVDIVDCRFRFGEENDNLYSKWHEAGMYGFILANPVAYEKPIPCKGQLGFFEVKEGITEFSPVFRSG